MKKGVLDGIDVKAPCSESWEEMTGNDEVRFCSHCSKNVFDLSAYTRARAEKLVRDSNGGLCVRYRKDERGRVITAPPRFTQIKRQAKIAAGVLATTLSVASMAYSQGQPGSLQPKAETTKRDKDKEPTVNSAFVVTGLVTDPAGAVVPHAEVTLVEKLRDIRRQTRSNDDGEYSFHDVESGQYELEVVSPGFLKMIIAGLSVAADTRANITLEVGEVTTGLLMITGEPVVCEDPPKVSSDIKLQEIVTLPLNRAATFVTMGLIPGIVEKPEEKKPAKKSKNKLPK